MKIISFELKKKEYHGCQHINVLIDEDLEFIECSKCGERLNPVKYLANLAKEEDTLSFRVNLLKEHIKTLEGRLRTKCRHCGKMTKI